MGTVEDMGIFRQMRMIEDPAELWRYVIDHLKARGAKSILVHRYVGLGPWQYGASGIKVQADGAPLNWLQDYIRNKEFLSDPLPYYARMTCRPFFWRDVEQEMRLTAEQRLCLDKQRAAGLKDGIGMHILGPELRDAYFGFTFGG